MKPLFVDLDGTLLFNDSLQETFWRLLLKNPWCAITAIFILFSQGRSAFKAFIANHLPLQSIQWAINPAVVQLLKTEKNRGRKIILLTASNEKIARAIAEPLNLFDHIEASSEKRNFKGGEKLSWIRTRYPGEEFLYAGNSRDDFVLWRHAHESIVVNPSNLVLKKAKKISKEIRLIQNRSNFLQRWKKTLRIHQYSKNLLIFIPLLLSGKFLQAGAFLDSLLAFIAFCSMASGSYILNDLVDIDNDRMHASKKNRPFAAGMMDCLFGLGCALGLMVISLVISAFLPINFLLPLIGYLILTVSYSFYLKRLAIIDVFTLSILYLVRIFAGSAATAIVISSWLFAFGLFFFLSLAYLKRFIEIDRLDETYVKGRNYKKQDLLLVKIYGICLGLISTLVFTLYLSANAAAGIYKYPQGLWFIALFLLYWINHVWHAAVHHHVYDDPVEFALKDKPSIIVGCCIVLIVIFCQGWIL
jgi:4-hydroxybenzoate polyprenyltransferase/phosphoserine phosphatase